MRLPLAVPMPVTVQVQRAEDALAEADLIVDTSARYVTLSKEVLLDVGYDPSTAGRYAHLIMARGVVDAPVLTLERVTVGDVSLTEVDAVCHGIPELPSVYGLLGMSFLHRCRCTFDGKEGLFPLGDP